MSDVRCHLPLYPQIPVLPKVSEILNGITNEKHERCISVRTKIELRKAKPLLKYENRQNGHLMVVD